MIPTLHVHPLTLYMTLLVVCLHFAAAPAEAQSEGFVDLINDDDLSGWI